jgi:acyl-CoA thioesterase I
MMLLLAGSLAAPQALAEEPVLILGDSLSAGYGISRDASWPSLLAARLEQEGYRQSVVNASISGETTAGGSRRIAPLIKEHAPAVVVIALGANDGLRGVDVTETRRNLLAMIRVAQAAGVAVVLVKVRIPPNYGPRYTEAFEDMFDEVAAAGDVHYAPFMLERFAARMSAFQADGLHPTAAVQPDILETVWPSIRQTLDASAMEYE